MKTGDIVTVALPGDTGKPRPAVLFIADQLSEGSSRVTVLPMTSDLMDVGLFRIDVEPHPINGLRKKSQIMVDRIASVNRTKIGSSIGKLDGETLSEAQEKLLAFLGLS